MSNSYIIELERLRTQLVNILRSKGRTIATDAPLSTAIPMTSAIGINDNFKKMCEDSPYEIDDVEGIITSFNLNSASTIKITKLSLPNCTQIVNENCCKDSTILTEVYLPSCVTFATYAFRNCTALNKITLADTIGSIPTSFLQNTGLTELIIGRVTGRINQGFLNNSTQIKIFKTVGSGSFSFLGTAGTTYTFYHCSSLRIADFGDTPSFVSGSADNTFNSCTNFKAFVIRKTDGVSTLETNKALLWLKNNVTGWYIYVPDDLVSSYKTASQWSTFADYFKPLSEYDEEAILLTA